MITAEQVATIRTYGADMIGLASLLYGAEHKLEKAVAQSHHLQLEQAFARIAGAMGYRLSRVVPEISPLREPAAQAAE